MKRKEAATSNEFDVHQEVRSAGTRPERKVGAPILQRPSGTDPSVLRNWARLMVIEGDAVPRKQRAGYLWSNERFGDFVLELEFNTTGNSGVFFRSWM